MAEFTEQQLREQADHERNAYGYEKTAQMLDFAADCKAELDALKEAIEFCLMPGIVSRLNKKAAEIRAAKGKET